MLDATLEEMKQLAEDDSLAAKFKTRCKQKSDQDDIVDKLPVSVYFHSAGEEMINMREAIAIRTTWWQWNSDTPSVEWNDAPVKALFKAFDPLGKKRQISVISEGEEQEPWVFYG